MANVDMVHVPYRGSAPALNDMLGGQVDVMADTLLATAAHVRAGKLKLIGVGSSTRLAPFPQVQAVAEVVPGFEAVTWMAIGAPPETPKAITRKLSDAIAQAVHTPDVKARIAELEAEPYGSSPEQMADLIRQSTERWQPVITSAHITID
jgi:tripartite-type tricarboxylate transporter receptor subunit TctC